MSPTRPALLALVGGLNDLCRQGIDVAREGVSALHRLADAAERLTRQEAGCLDVEAAAQVLGEHPSTMRRRIAALPEPKRPRWTGTAQRRRYYWQSAPDLYRWLESLEERPPTRAPRRPRREARGGGITDFVSVARGKT